MEANPRIRGRLADVIVGTGPKQLKRIVAAGQQIVATDRHPFYTANTGEWTDAANLQQGDQLVGADGSLQTVSALIDADHTTTVYNLTVDDIHTYYAGDAPVLVHNCGELGQPGALRQAVDVHNMVTDSRRHRQSTFALAEVRMPDGARQIFASGSSGRLSRAQQNRLHELGVPRRNIRGGGAHAEINIIDSMPEGASPVRWGIAWAGHNKPIPCSACRPRVQDTVEGASIDIITPLVRAKVAELAQRPQQEIYVALAALWGRVWVLAAPGWHAWPEARALVGQAMACALDRAVDENVSPDGQRVANELLTLGIEDDGSEQWQHLTDLVAMLTDTLCEQDLRAVLKNSLTWHLEGMFNVLSNHLAATLGRPISMEEADVHVPEHDRWLQAARFVNAL